MGDEEKPTPADDRSRLEAEKLQAEIDQIRLAIRNDSKRWLFEYALKVAVSIGAGIGSLIFLALKEYFSNGG